MSWFRRGPKPVPDPRRAASGSAELTREQRSTRELYRDFLQACVRLGLVRAKHQTPGEFAAYLAAERPEARGPVEELTRAYVRTRYAEQPVDRRQVREMREAVERAVALLRNHARPEEPTLRRRSA